MSEIGSIEAANRLRSSLLNSQSGKWLSTQLYPDEFEYYMVAFELLRSDLTSEKYFIFPVNPNSIDFNDTSLTKITKTAGGVSVLRTDQFNIKDITLAGTFGRTFKVLTGSSFTDIVSYFSDTLQGKDSSLDNFSMNVKTGYGCAKVLEKILNLSVQNDELGGSRYLVFYNLAFNQKLLVEFESKSFSQSVESNMIWNYNVRLKVIGNADDYLKKENTKSTTQLTTDRLLQKNANAVFNKIAGLLNKKF